jgi:hypothetical protein
MLWYLNQQTFRQSTLYCSTCSKLPASKFTDAPSYLQHSHRILKFLKRFPLYVSAYMAIIKFKTIYVETAVLISSAVYSNTKRQRPITDGHTITYKGTAQEIRPNEHNSFITARVLKPS